MIENLSVLIEIFMDYELERPQLVNYTLWFDDNHTEEVYEVTFTINLN